MNKTFKFLSLVAGGALLVGCQEFDYGFSSDDLKYKQSFVEQFGDIDPTQDFNMASQYASLCATRGNSTTRAGVGDPVPPSGWTVTVGEQQLITAAEVDDAKTYFPEGTFSPSNYAAANAYYISDGKPLYLRPIYSQTNSANTIGVYNVENPDEKLPIITMNGDDWKTTTAGRGFGYVYEVNIPKGAKYGFYLSRTDGHTHYSEVSLNRANGIYGEYGTCQDCNITLAQGGAYLGFEDWGHSGGNDYDCNDMIFHVSPTLVDKLVKLDSWIIACEDLGNVVDIDFNDVVLDVEINGTSLSITALAAGGTVPSVVYFKEGENGEAQSLGEIHSLLGSLDYTQPINATFDYPSRGVTKTFTVSSDYDLVAGLARGDIYIVTNQTSYGFTNAANSQVISSCTVAGEAPKAIIVPSSWEWPHETTPITTAYPDFTKWVSNTTYDVWITNKKAGEYVKRITANNESAGGDTPTDPTDMPTYVEGKGFLVDLTKDGIHNNDNYQYILPSYFASAQASATITIEGTTQSIAIYSGKDGTSFGFTYSYELTEDKLEDAKKYGIELRNWTSKSDFNWSNVKVYVMIDGTVDDGNDDGNDEGNNDGNDEGNDQDTVNPNLTTPITEGIANNMVLSADYFPSTCTKATVSFTHNDSNNRMYIAFQANGNHTFGFESSTANETISHELSSIELTAAKAGTLKLTDYGNNLLQNASKIVIVTE